LDYQTLLEVWRSEKTSAELQRLSKEFYAEVGSYIRSRSEELQMLDKESMCAHLINQEVIKAQRLIRDTVRTRLRKIIGSILEGRQVATDTCTREEEVILSELSLAKQYTDQIIRDVLRGRPPQIVKTYAKSSRVIIRVLQDIPAIVGPNTRIYGPFKAEDIAALPAENAESLIKRGIAVRVEV
jgi:DNA replication factor GINS